MTLANCLARAGVLSLAVAISACSVYSLPGQTPEQVPPAETTSAEPSVVTPTPERTEVPATAGDREPVAAYTPLIQKAESATARGDYEQALVLLERAQRIDPDSPDVYLALARTHSQRGDSAQARANAERGLLYCSEPQQCKLLRAYAQ